MTAKQLGALVDRDAVIRFGLSRSD